MFAGSYEQKHISSTTHTYSHIRVFVHYALWQQVSISAYLSFAAAL